MQDYEYEDYAGQFEEACKRLAPKLHLRVWRWEEVTRRLPKPGSLESQGQVT